MSEVLSEGQNAPDFKISTSDGREVNLSHYSGSRLVIFFYPKDNTPGCTTEALEFTENSSNFKDANTQILGVSRDSLKKHSNFIEKHSLNLELGSDDEGKMCNSYDVWKEKKNYGKTYMGIERSTFLIDENGQILKVWRKVKVKDHVGIVLETVKTLGK